MITSQQSEYILEHAYVPEQVTSYVMAIAPAEPFLLGDFLAYRREKQFVFVGYPLREVFDEKKMEEALNRALKQFHAHRVTVIASSVPRSIRPEGSPLFDQYYRLDLTALAARQKVRNMIRRAERQLRVVRHKTFSQDHRELVREFLKNHTVDEQTRFIFGKIPDYVSSCETAWILDARNDQGELVAFDVVEMAAKEYAFYMFNFTSRLRFVPGASDLLLWEMIQHAKGEKKKYLNLGLGISPGVTFFKKKWGGEPFLSYSLFTYVPPEEGEWEGLWQKL